MDPLDHPAFPLRPINGTWVEKVIAPGLSKYGNYCCGGFITE
jgi:hypothetical protein